MTAMYDFTSTFSIKFVTSQVGKHTNAAHVIKGQCDGGKCKCKNWSQFSHNVSGFIFFRMSYLQADVK